MSKLKTGCQKDTQTSLWQTLCYALTCLAAYRNTSLMLRFVYSNNTQLLESCITQAHMGGTVGLCVKCSPLTKVTLVRFLVGAICEMSCALVLCCAKNQTLSIMAVLRGHKRLMWLAAKGALACLLLEHVVRDDQPPKLLLLLLLQGRVYFYLLHHNDSKNNVG